MSMKTRLGALEAEYHERELDRCARFLAERHGLPVTEIRQEIKAVIARRQAGGNPPLSPEELQQAEELRQQVDTWEGNRG
jgi:hypothetical protein